LNLLMPCIHIDFGIDDKLKPLGYVVGELNRECWLIDIERMGIDYVRINDTDIVITDRDLTKLILFYATPDLEITTI
jgi:hypothetical protein